MAPTLRPGWPLLLIGIFAFHGVAEEVVWRGYAFRRLRVGRTFGRAVAWTMPILAATHVPVMVTSGPVVGVAAMLVAAVTTLPLSYLYEIGRNTIWAPAVVHTAIDSFKLVIVPAAAVATFSLLLSAFSLLVALLGTPSATVPRRVPTFGLSMTGLRADCGHSSDSLGVDIGLAGHARPSAVHADAEISKGARGSNFAHSAASAALCASSI